MKLVDSVPARNRGFAATAARNADVVLHAADVEPVEGVAQPVDRGVAVGAMGESLAIIGS